MQEKYLDRREAAEYLTNTLGLKITWKTLQKMATAGGGPTYRIFGMRAVYLASDLTVWAEAKLSAPRVTTSEAA